MLISALRTPEKINKETAYIRHLPAEKISRGQALDKEEVQQAPSTDRKEKPRIGWERKRYIKRHLAGNLRVTRAQGPVAGKVLFGCDVSFFSHLHLLMNPIEKGTEQKGNNFCRRRFPDFCDENLNLRRKMLGNIQIQRRKLNVLKRGIQVALILDTRVLIKKAQNHGSFVKYFKFSYFLSRDKPK